MAVVVGCGRGDPRPPGVATPALVGDGAHRVTRPTASERGAGIARSRASGDNQEGPPPGTLDLSIQRHGTIIELGLAGDLDMATAPRIGEAMAWLRFSSDPGTTIVIDTTRVEFIAAAGYRALEATRVGPGGLWDPHVALIVGPAVARLEAAISAASQRRSVPRRKGGR
jgi:hypothetical protein